jgi:hypothetical protein
LVLLGFPLIAQQAVSPVGFSRSTHAIHAFSPSGDVTLQASRQKLDVQYPHGRKERGDMLVVYDPQNGRYLWRYQPGEARFPDASFLHAFEAGDEAVYATPSALWDFRMNAELNIKEETERAGGLDDAERLSIEEIKRGLPTCEGMGFHADATRVALYKLLYSATGMDFACAPVAPPMLSDSGCGWQVKSIVSVGREGENWRLVLRNRWDQEVILDSKFGLVSTKRLEKTEK